MNEATKPARPTAHVIRAIAVACHRDPRAVRNAIEGRAKPIVIEAVREAVARLGLAIDIPSPNPPPAAA